MDKQYIKEIALDNGFKLKKQTCGKMDLNPYVYQFSDALCGSLSQRIVELEASEEISVDLVETMAEAGIQLEQERDQLKAQNAELLSGLIGITAHMFRSALLVDEYDEKEATGIRNKGFKAKAIIDNRRNVRLAEIQAKAIEDFQTYFDKEYYGEELSQFIEQYADKLRQQAIGISTQTVDEQEK